MPGSIYTEEVVAIRGLGLQLTTTKGFKWPLPLPIAQPSWTYPLSAVTTFVPLSSIGDVIINEGVYGWGVIYYLAIVTWASGQGSVQGAKSEPKLVVAFPELLPRLKDLRDVWQGVRATLFDELGQDIATDGLDHACDGWT